MKSILLFRKELASKYELSHAEKYFPIEESRVRCNEALVIGRYSVLPLYEELERDLALLGSRLINTFAEHQWISTFAYYYDLKEYTPETWDEETFRTSSVQGPFVVKGKMSSKKRRWKTHMFAKTRRDALRVAERLKEDSQIDEQGVVFRKFVPLKTLEVGPNELPYTNEWRFFYLKDRRLSAGYYWSMGDCAKQAELKPEGLALADKVAAIASRHATYFALDVAETENGDWLFIELNDGQTAVPCENDQDELYKNLRAAIDEMSC